MAPSVMAQPCERQWQPLAGPDGWVAALTVWDPDGAGPEPARLVVGGVFNEVGGVAANAIAALNLETGEWAGLGEGMIGGVWALASLTDGSLVAAGRFEQAGGVEDAGWIARWDGVRWHAMGAGMGGGATGPGVSHWPGVYGLAALPSGDLIAAGNFDTAGGVAAAGVARWDGASWHPLGSGLNPNGFARALTVTGGGDVVVGGHFETAGGVAANNVARWDGSEWHALGSGVRGGEPESAWGVLSLAAHPSGDMFAGGWFKEAGGQPASRVARWDGEQWHSLDGGISGFLWEVWALTVLGSDVIVAGTFTTAGGAPAANIARWDGDAWHPLDDGAGGSVRALAVMPNGDLAVGGMFLTAGGLDSPHLAIWGCADCYADCDESGALDFSDFLCFQNLFTTGSAAADCDESGALDFFDFLCFQNAFAAGCP